MIGIWRLVEALCAVVFLLGSLATWLGGLGVWLYLVVGLARDIGWLAGVLALILTFLAAARYGPYMLSPLQWWVQLWVWAEREIGHKKAKMQLEVIAERRSRFASARKG